MPDSYIDAPEYNHGQKILPYQPWMNDALCRINKIDTTLFFLEHGNAYLANKIKRICDSCPVENLCLEYATHYKINFGIWGGKSPSEREDVRRIRRLSMNQVTLPSSADG